MKIFSEKILRTSGESNDDRRNIFERTNKTRHTRGSSSGETGGSRMDLKISTRRYGDDGELTATF